MYELVLVASYAAVYMHVRIDYHATAVQLSRVGCKFVYVGTGSKVPGSKITYQFNGEKQYKLVLPSFCPSSGFGVGA
jgi:hypothetical protein